MWFILIQILIQYIKNRINKKIITNHQLSFPFVNTTYHPSKTAMTHIHTHTCARTQIHTHIHIYTHPHTNNRLPLSSQHWTSCQEHASNVGRTSVCQANWHCGCRMARRYKLPVLDLQRIIPRRHPSRWSSEYRISDHNHELAYSNDHGIGIRSVQNW